MLLLLLLVLELLLLILLLRMLLLLLLRCRLPDRSPPMPRAHAARAGGATLAAHAVRALAK